MKEIKLHMKEQIQDTRFKIEKLWSKKNGALHANTTLLPVGTFPEPGKAELNMFLRYNHHLDGFPSRGENPEGKRGDKNIKSLVSTIIVEISILQRKDVNYKELA